MTDIVLTEEDKESLLEYLTSDTCKENAEIYLEEIEHKLNKKINRLLKKKKLPAYVDKMLSRIHFLLEQLEDGVLSEILRDQTIGALHYFIKAEDIIPDYIPVVGYLDDAFVISVVYQKVKSETK